MRIEIRGRNVEVDEELREHVIKRFRRVGKQVSELATLDVEISEERNPSIADSQVAEATLRLKGVDPARARGLAARWPTRSTSWPRTSAARSRSIARCAASGGRTRQRGQPDARPRRSSRSASAVQPGWHHRYP